MPKPSKTDLKQIRALSKKIPLTGTDRELMLPVYGSEILAKLNSMPVDERKPWKESRGIGGKYISSKKRHLVISDQMEPVNHYRKLKKLYAGAEDKAEGIKILTQYFQDVIELVTPKELPNISAPQF